MRIALAPAIAAIAMAASAHAATSPLVVESSILAEHKQAAADGSVAVKLVPAAKVVPGDKVVFVLDYRNTARQALGDLVFDNPVPQGIAYRAPAKGSPAPDLSVDGKTYGTLATLTVATQEGGRRAATADDVTHVRWRLATPLPAGAKGQFAFQAVLK